MKVKVTQKQIMESYPMVIVLPYCAVQYLLYYTEPRYYTSGIYGWNADIYHISNKICIVTGYHPFGNIRPDYDFVRHYEDLARDNYYDNTLDSESIKQINKELLDEFIAEIEESEEK